MGHLQEKTEKALAVRLSSPLPLLASVIGAHGRNGLSIFAGS